MTDRIQKHIDLAINLYAHHNYHDAGRVLEAVLQAQPQNPDAIYMMGLYQWQFGDGLLGIKFVKRAVELKPELQDYDFQRERLLNQGKSMMQVWEMLYSEYLRFQTIDAFLISFPKCGRTWLRAMLGWYVNDLAEGDPMEVMELTKARQEFCTLDISHDDFPHLKTAENLATNKNAYRGKKVIFMIRDPRDVVVSNFFQFTKRGDQKVVDDKFAGTLSEFIRYEIGGLANLVEFYNIWAENKSVPKAYLVVSYEELSRSPKQILAKCIDMLGWPDKGETFIDDIVAKESFNSMREMERTNELRSVRLSPSGDGDPEGFKTRKGKVGGYVDYLSNEDLEYISSYLKTHLHADYAAYKY
ncbi:MAG: sulfotransferase domain-containing protein [Rhodospirillales bacterium]|nr:sulfotransferase domain-containing protein [Rhodospirillales bacterium]